MYFSRQWGRGNEENRQNLCPRGTYILVGRQNKQEKHKSMLANNAKERERQAVGIGNVAGNFSNLNKADREGVPQKVI